MKRILMLALVLSLLCSFGAPVTAQNGFQPVIYGKEVKILTDLGITTVNVDGAQNNTAVTRAELVVLAVKAMGYSNAENGTYTEKFTDVPSSHWAFPYIMFAVQAGLFRGTGETTFEPDEPADASQAVCTMLKMLNCEKLAEAKGGYPAGYWVTAADRKLLNGVNIKTNDIITRDQLYIMLYNTIHADMLMYDSVGSDMKFSIQKGRSILTENHGIYYVEGVVTADNETAFIGEPTKKENAFRIGDMTFLADDKMGQGKVGRKVTVYYKESGFDYYDAAALWNEDNTEVTLTADSIVDFNYENGIYEVKDGDKNLKFKIGREYYLVYNGDTVTGSDRSLMNPQSCHITLIDNNKDDIYDVVFVYEYYNLIFGRYDKYTNELKDKTGDAGKTVELDKYDKIITNVEDFSALKEPAVLTVYKSLSGNTVKIMKSEQVASGDVTKVEYDNTAEYTLGGKQYQASLAPRFNTDEINVGQRYTFYMDIYGRVAYVEIAVAQSGGYVAEFGDEGGMGSSQVRIYTARGTLSVYNLADKVKIIQPDGSSTVSGKEVENVFARQPGAKRLYVLYKLNQDKQINEIVMPKIIKTEAEYEARGGYLLYKMDYYVENWPNSSSTAYLQYKTKNMGFGNWLICGDSTAVLNVPAENQQSFSEEDFAVSSVSSEFKSDETISVKKGNSGNKSTNEIDVYKIGDTGYEPEILIRFGRGEKRGVTDDADVAVIKDMKMVYDENEGSALWQLTFVVRGKEQTALLDTSVSNTREGILNSPYSSSMSVPELAENKNRYKAGDIVKYTTKAGKITNLCLLYDGINQKIAYTGLEQFNRIFRLAVGTVKVIDGNYIEQSITSSGITERSRISGCSVIVMDVKNEKVTAGSAADITVDDDAVIYSRYSDNKTVVVYKNR